MAYIGNTPANIFTSLETQTITGDGSTEYTLTHAVSSGKDILVYINNVKQEEGSGKSYTATGSTITFSDAVASTDSCYLLYVNRAIATHTPADASVDADAIAGSAVVAGKIASGAVTTAKIAADAVTNAKIADDAIDSEHYTDGSIDTAHLGDLQVTTAKIAADAITGAKIADDAIDSEHYTDGSIDTAHIADAQITSAKIANATLVLPNKLDMNGNELILDADADTSITSDTDDQIDIHIAGADDFRFTANNMNVLSGSTLTIDSGATITNSGTASGFGITWNIGSAYNSNFNASAGNGYFVSTSGGAVTATLPASPSAGDEIRFIDLSATFDSNNLTVGRNGKPIMGAASDLTVATERAGLGLVFSDDTNGWLLIDK
tara:strand:- start:649 stop:1785 length:1137 start_codon:yes stop_codon:yes gene_type:complete